MSLEKPISEKQLEANRRNARRSTGPRTPEGKRVSRTNAIRHNLTGQLNLMEPAERAAYDAFFVPYVEALKPDGPIERDLAEAVAESAWRLKRARALDQNMFAAARPEFNGDPGSQDDPDTAIALADADAFLANAKEFQTLTLYEQRIQRSMQKSMEQLRALQTERKAAREQALNQAKNLAQHSYSMNKPWDPAVDFPPENGFVFSTAEINAAIRRERRFKEANRANFSNFEEPGYKIVGPDLIDPVDLPDAA